MRFYRRYDNPFANLWGDFDRLSRQMDRAFGRRTLFGNGLEAGTAGVFPLLNVTESADHYSIRAELPGIKSDELDLQATARSVTLSGERKAPKEEGGRYHRREREQGRFSRVLGLPGEIDPGGIEATMKNGVLTIRVPKAEAVKPRQIAIN